MLFALIKALMYTIVSQAIEYPMTTVICGIDPGLNGAFAFIDLEDKTLEIVDMPTKEKNGKRHVDPVAVGAILNQYLPDQAFLEQVHSSPQMGVSSSFSFGRSSGIILGAAGASCVPVTEVPPSVWKPRMGCSADKKQTVAQATKLIPSGASAWKLVKHTDRAEAALIALYGAVVGGRIVGPLTLKT
jgi:Holliday junction resolvasome RuvABC endonuclease subunit